MAESLPLFYFHVPYPFYAGNHFDALFSKDISTEIIAYRAGGNEAKRIP